MNKPASLNPPDIEAIHTLTSYSRHFTNNRRNHHIHISWSTEFRHRNNCKDAPHFIQVELWKRISADWPERRISHQDTKERSQRVCELQRHYTTASTRKLSYQSVLESNERFSRRTLWGRQVGFCKDPDITDHHCVYFMNVTLFVWICL